MSPDAILIHGAPASLPDLFHAIPAPIGDPFLYLEAGGRRAAAVGTLDAGPRFALVAGRLNCAVFLSRLGEIQNSSSLVGGLGCRWVQ